MDHSFLGYDPDRVAELGFRVVDAVERLDAVRSTEPIAEDALAAVRQISARLSVDWLPLLRAVATDPSLLARTNRGDVPSAADVALTSIAAHFATADRDDDGELTWTELESAMAGVDAELAAACGYFVDHPLAFANTALAASTYSIADLDDVNVDNIYDGGWDVDMDPDSDAPMWQSLTLTESTIAAALEQNRHQRTLADFAVYAAADGARDDGRIDGRISLHDLETLMARSDDPAVVAMCEYFLANPHAFQRIDREGPDTDFDGLIALDQLYQLGINQGALGA
jgi:hypothetical protein